MKTARCLFIGFLMAFSLFSGKAEATRWERLSEYEDTMISVDRESVRQISETVAGAQFKIAFTEPSWMQKKSIDYYLIGQENDCRRNTYRVHQVTVYFKDGTDDIYRREEEHEVNPGTFQSVIHEFLCKKTRK